MTKAWCFRKQTKIILKDQLDMQDNMLNLFSCLDLNAKSNISVRSVYKSQEALMLMHYIANCHGLCLLFPV